MASGIDVQQGLLQGDIAEGADERDVHFGFGNRDVDTLPVSVTEFEKIFAADIGDQVTEGAVGSDDLAAQAALVEVGGCEIEPDEFVHVQFRPYFGPVTPTANMGTDR